MDNYELIARAIRNREQVIAEYDGHHREMTPHILATVDGVRRCLFYQFAGQSGRPLAPAGSPLNWRWMRVDRLAGLHTRPGEWHAAPEHTRPRRCLRDVDLQAA